MSVISPERGFFDISVRSLLALRVLTDSCNLVSSRKTVIKVSSPIISIIFFKSAFILCLLSNITIGQPDSLADLIFLILSLFFFELFLIIIIILISEIIL